MSAFFGCDAVVVEERFLHPALAFFCLASSNEHHCSMTISIQRRCSMTISIQRFLLQYSSVFFMFLLSLIDACCLVLVKASLRACVAGCCHLLWHFCFVCSYVCCLSVPSSPCRLSFPRSFPNTKRKGKKITCTYWVDVVSCLVSPAVVSGRCAVGKCVKN